MKLAGGLKDIERFKGQFFWKDYPQQARYQSVADHTWRMALLLMLVEKDLSQPIDMAKAMKMAIVHDLAEVIAGDLSPLGTDGTGKDSHIYNAKAAEAKFENELAAAKKMFGTLPQQLGEVMLGIWLEYEKQEAFEAKVVKAVDKIEGKLQAAEYAGGKMVDAHLDFSLKYGLVSYEADPALKSLGLAVNEELKKDQGK